MKLPPDVPKRYDQPDVPRLHQKFDCVNCGYAAFTRRTRYLGDSGSEHVWEEEVYCSNCRMKVVIQTPARDWPRHGYVKEYTQTQSLASKTVRWPPKLEDIGPPQILCSSCGEVLEKTDDCYRCKCGREVRP